MELVRLEAPLSQRWPWPAVAVGNFDGVHRGHQALVDTVVREAAAMQGTAVVLTFDPHPSRVLVPHKAPPTLTTLAQKAEVLSGLGVEKLAVVPFTPALAREPAERFAREFLSDALGARLVAVGSNFRFGHGRGGGPGDLVALGEVLGFRVLVLEPVQHGGVAISSTRVREAVEQGEVGLAGDLLGRAFSVDGEVVPGEGRGRTLGIPTANLDVANEILPPPGVYACWCERLPVEPGQRWRAALNIGHRPTFGPGERTVEAHLLDFEGDLYGRRLRLTFVERLREEHRFPDASSLLAQIHDDLARARRALVAGADMGPTKA